jgi:hypothetical protein
MAASSPPVARHAIGAIRRLSTGFSQVDVAAQVKIKAKVENFLDLDLDLDLTLRHRSTALL